MQQNKHTLIERWQTGSALTLAQQIKACWLFGKDPCVILPLEKHEGRWDFRGLDLTATLPSVVLLPDGIELRMKDYRNEVHGDSPVSFNNIHFADCDFSFACVKGLWLEHCIFENVLFCGANGEGVRDEASIFRQVDFSQAYWYFSTLGISGAYYENCVFVKTDLRRVVFYCGYFENCHFGNTKWSQDIDFSGSHFIQSKVSGKVRKVSFRAIEDGLVNENCGCSPIESNSPIYLDLSDAHVEELYAMGKVDVSRVVLPKDGCALLIVDWDVGLRKLTKAIKDSWGDMEVQTEAMLLDRIIEYRTFDDSRMQFFTLYQLEKYSWDITPPEEKSRVIDKFWKALLQISAEEKGV